MKLILALMCFTLIAQPAMSQLAGKLDSVIAASVQAEEPGIALYVESNGKLLYKKAFGLSAVGGAKLKATSNFRMASVSKQFTAMSILLLEKEGKVSFEDPISRFFPQISSAVGNTVKLRHLLTHSSGIIDYESVMDDESTIQLLDDDVLELLTNQDTTYFTPGSKFRYSNSGYALLALITEKISGQTFPDFVNAHIFKPLKMKKSLVYMPSSKIAHRAMGFARNRNNNLFPNDQSSTSAVKGDGGVYTSVDDYSKWIHALWNNSLVDLPSTLTRLNFPIKEHTGSFYGPGWFYFNKEQPSLFHSGSTCGFSTFSINIPSSHTAIFYFSNVANNSGPFKKILDVLAGEGIANPGQIFELHELTR